MPAIGVQHCLRDFDDCVQNTVQFLQEARSFRVLMPTGTYRHIGIRRVELLAGMVLLKAHVAWEDFLENVFVRYLCGVRSAGGSAPVLIGSPEPTISSAMTALLAPNRPFLNWTAQTTLRRAGIYFDAGEPFATAIGAIGQTLDDISAVRNRFAHRSEFSANTFRNVVLRAFGYVPRGMSAGRFLLTINPSPSSGGLNFLESYTGALIGASRLIVQ